MLKLTFLGTSAGLPTKQRNVTGLAVSLVNPFAKQKQKPWLLIDCGEGTQQQILKTKLSLMQLHTICITHMHGDHCYGLPGLLSSMGMSGRTAPLTIIAPLALSKFLDVLTITTELYFPFAIEFIALESLATKDSFQPVVLNIAANHSISIEPIALSHRVASHGFKITQTINQLKLAVEKLQNNNIAARSIWRKLQTGYDVTLDNGQVLMSKDFTKLSTYHASIIVGGDNDNPMLLAPFLAGVDLVVHEATYTHDIAERIKNKTNGFDPKHSTAKQVAAFAQSNHLKNLILTHFSARYQCFENRRSKTANMGHIREEVAEHYDGNVWLAKDFDEFEVKDHTVIFNPR